MQLSSLLSACLRNGVTISVPDPKRPNSYAISLGDRRLTFTSQDGYVRTLTWHSPQTDAMTDCYCDSYYHTIKDAMSYLNPSGVLASFHRPVVRSNISANDVPTDTTVSRNLERGGIEIRFSEKPTDDILASLHDHDFRWSRFNRVWWKKFNDADYNWAMSTFVKVHADTVNELEIAHS